jgi:hypothetical protein
MAVAASPTAAQFSSGNILTSEGYALPRDHQYERYDAATSTYGRVDVNQVPALINQKAWIYDRTAQAWVYRPRQGWIQATRAGARDRRRADWARIHGVVQSVQGSTLRLRAADGRTLSVDMSKVAGNIRSGLTQGEPVTVIGHEW